MTLASLAFEGGLGGSLAVKAKRLPDLAGKEFTLDEGFELKIEKDRTLTGKAATLKIEAVEGAVLRCMVRGTFLLEEREVKVSGPVRATEKKE